MTRTSWLPQADIHGSAREKARPRNPRPSEPPSLGFAPGLPVNTSPYAL
jgi:hypothetical protein